MSKSLRNYPDVSEVFDRDGVGCDALVPDVSSVLRGGNLVVTEEGIREGVRECCCRCGARATSSPCTRTPPELSPRSARATRRRGAPTRRTCSTATSSRRPASSCARSPTTSRRSTARWRPRSCATSPTCSPTGTSAAPATGSGSATDDRRAFDTLYTVLETLTRVAAPLIPLVSEEIWQGLTGGRSVHLADWPDADRVPRGPTTLVAAMDACARSRRSASRCASATGCACACRSRASRSWYAACRALAPFEDILRDELNVKSVELVEVRDDTALAAYGITQPAHRSTPARRARGSASRCSRSIQAAKAGDWSRPTAAVTVGRHRARRRRVRARARGRRSTETRRLAFLPGGGFVLLDTDATPELEAEGLARDVIRAVQDTRKAAGLDVSDRIRLGLDVQRGPTPTALRSRSRDRMRATLAAETLAGDRATLSRRDRRRRARPWPRTQTRCADRRRSTDHVGYELRRR